MPGSGWFLAAAGILIVLAAPADVARAEPPRQTDLENLDPAVLIVPFPADPRAADSSAGKSKVAVWVELAGEAFQDLLGTPELTLELDARALDPSGEERDAFARRERFDAAEVGARLSSAGLRVYGALTLSPGAYQLDLSVVLEGAGHGAARRLPFEVPSSGIGEPWLLPPFFLDDLGEAVVVEHEPDGPERQVGYPFVTGEGERFVPVISPVITTDAPRARICLFGSGLLRGDALLDAVLVAEDGSPLSKERLVLMSSAEAGSEPEHGSGSGAASGGLDRLLFALDTAGLSAGIYGLEVRLHSLGKGSSRSTYMPFRVAASDGP